MQIIAPIQQKCNFGLAVFVVAAFVVVVFIMVVFVGIVFVIIVVVFINILTNNVTKQKLFFQQRSENQKLTQKEWKPLPPQKKVSLPKNTGL